MLASLDGTPVEIEQFSKDGVVVIRVKKALSDAELKAFAAKVNPYFKSAFGSRGIAVVMMPEYLEIAYPPRDASEKRNEV